MHQFTSAALNRQAPLARGLLMEPRQATNNYAANRSLFQESADRGINEAGGNSRRAVHADRKVLMAPGPVKPGRHQNFPRRRRA